MTNNLITRRIRYMLLISILLSAFSVMKASTFPASVDSLQTLLKNDTDARQRAIIYIHLADIYVVASGIFLILFVCTKYRDDDFSFLNIKR